MGSTSRVVERDARFYFHPPPPAFGDTQPQGQGSGRSPVLAPATTAAKQEKPPPRRLRSRLSSPPPLPSPSPPGTTRRHATNGKRHCHRPLPLALPGSGSRRALRGARPLPAAGRAPTPPLAAAGRGRCHLPLPPAAAPRAAPQPPPLRMWLELEARRAGDAADPGPGAARRR